MKIKVDADFFKKMDERRRQRPGARDWLARMPPSAKKDYEASGKYQLIERYADRVHHAQLLFSTGPGWWPILTELVDDLLELGWDGDIHQTKEKFGGLRFYIGKGSDVIYERIRIAEEEALQTCEICGETEGVTTGGERWIRTLCPKHMKEHNEPSPG